jgi:hypothetical protein
MSEHTAENDGPAEAVTDPDTGIVYFPDDDAPNSHAICLIGDDEWHQTFLELGYRCCVRCRLHHRHPETCLEDAENEARAHVHEWEVEYLPDPMGAGSVVRSGDLMCWCGVTREDTP